LQSKSPYRTPCPKMNTLRRKQIPHFQNLKIMAQYLQTMGKDYQDETITLINSFFIVDFSGTLCGKQQSGQAYSERCGHAGAITIRRCSCCIK
jgi:hypothetical protein